MQGIDKVLVFDIWGDYAHFRKIETTTSPLTYFIPTGTSLAGLLSGIAGLERNSYYHYFYPENAKLSIGVLKSLKKVRININLIKTDDGFYLWDIEKDKRFPAPFEFVKEPKYRIYIWLNDRELYNKLKEYLQYHKCFYTPYLGISELIANFSFVGEFEATMQHSNNEAEIHTVVRKDKSQLIVEPGKLYIKERIPIYMDSNRVVQEYADVFLEANGRPIKVKSAVYYKIGEENVVFL